MAHATPTRRALVDLPVNSFSTPSAVRAMGKESTGHKRRIHEVEEPESAQPTCRVCLSPARSASTLKENNPREDARFFIPCTSTEMLTTNPANAMTSNTAEPTGELGEGDSQHSYKDSISSLIDFDPDETLASQQTAATELTQPSPSRVSRHVETLRLRLRLAHFKVQTNQTNIPLSQLRISRRGDEDEMLSPASSRLDGQPSLPRLLAAPVLRPTAYSARTITQMQVPSSPPSSADNSPGKDCHNEVFRTPALPRHATHISLQQTSSPPDSQKGSRYNDEDDLTSSAVRGKAAIGLLGLRRER